MIWWLNYNKREICEIFKRLSKAMASKPREILIDLERDGPHTPWGIRLVGGSDLNTPLIITKVLYFNHFL